MAEVAEQHFDAMGLEPDRIAGVAATRRGYGRPTRLVELIEAGHPVPDRECRGGRTCPGACGGCQRRRPRAGAALRRRLGQLDRPMRGPMLAEKQAVNRALFKSGAAICDINTVRKHLSRIKGGRLARSAYPAT